MQPARRPVLLPRPPARVWPRAGEAALLLASATALLAPASLRPWALLPGAAEYPDLPGTTSLYWLVQHRGLLGAMHQRLLMFPATTDRVLLDGFPLDALLARPLLAALGWPAGFTVFQVLVLWGLGLAGAALGRAWWRGGAAAAVAGVALQAAPALLREVAEGRPTQVLALALLVASLVPALRALAGRGDGRAALLAGALGGASALAWWFAGLFWALAVGAMVVASALEGGRPLRAFAQGALGAVAVAGLPAAYAFAGLADIPGADATPAAVVRHAGHALPLAILLKQRSLPGAAVHGALAPTPVLLGLAAAAIPAARARRVAVPLAWTAAGVLLAFGPWIALPGDAALPGPFLLLGAVPGLRRFWWPERALLLAAPGLALLAAGGAALLARRLPPRGRALAGSALAVLLVVEAFAVVPSLPVPSADGRPSERARVLARRTGPAVVLPLSPSAVIRDARVVLDQLHHGRPLVDGPVPPDSEAAPAAWRLALRLPGLAHLVDCEPPGAPPFAGDAEEARAALAAAGVRDVYADLEAGRALPDPEGWRACIESLLGPPAAREGPYLRYALP